MTRQIRLDQIDDLMAEAVQELVKKTTLQWTALTKKATPRDSGDLANSWKTDIRKYKGTISTILEYAEQLFMELHFHQVGKVNLEQNNKQ